MKKLLSIIVFSLFSFMATAQVYKTVDVTTAGTLGTLLTPTELSTLTNLTVTGNIDARDVKIMRDNMPMLAVLDIGVVNIQAYTGSAGTNNGSYTYPANEMPENSFYNGITYLAKLTLKTITFPTTITSIGNSAFNECTGLAGSLTLPNSVTSIGDIAFSGCSGLSGSLILPNSVTKIGGYAFNKCSGFTGSLTLPNSVTKIEVGSFNECLGFTGSLIIPNSVTSIGERAFGGCRGFTGILTLPNSLISIGREAFGFCSGFTGSLIIPDSLITIENGAFHGCSSLSGSLILPNSVTTIGEYAFYGCSGFTGSLTLPNSVTKIGEYAFDGCSGFTGSLTLPNSVTKIGGYTFRNCIGFSGILTLPNSLTTIGDYAFYSCTGFNFINSFNTTPPTIVGANTFTNVRPIFVNVPTSSVSAYKAASGWSGFTIVAEKHVTINVPTAGGMAAAIIEGGFGPLNSITHLTVTGNINSIDINQMKTNMTALTAIDLLGTIIESNALPVNAFQGRTSITSVMLPSNLQSIGEYAFDGCVNLSGNIPLPALVTSIGVAAFQNCSSLSGILTIPVGVSVINNYTFANCNKLTGNIIIPNSVTKIGNAAFGICSGFTGSLTIPNTVTSLGSSAFQSCSGITGTLTLSNTLTMLPDYVFQGCSQLSGKVEVPLSVMSIGSTAFKGCTKITELSVGKNLTSIGEYALYGCNSLAKISVSRTTPPTVYANTFTGIPVENCTINVPTGASITYQIANYWSAFIHFAETLSSDNYTVTVSIGAGGSVKENNISLGNGSVLTASIGSTKTFTFVPNAGCAVATVTYNGADVTSQLVNFQYTTPAINANATLVVTFKKTQYLLSIKSAESGAVNLLCEYGATPSFNFIAYSGWNVNTLMYNGVDITNSLTNGVYKVPAVTADALLTVSFEQANALQISSVSNVKVYSNSSDLVVEGSTEGEIITLFTINGKQIQSVKSQGGRIAIPAQKDRMYLVKTEGRTFKVML